MIKLKLQKPRILDFDTECRPMHYSEWRPESQITAIAWSWVGSGIVHSHVLEQDLANEHDMFRAFLRVYDEADMVTGHYIVKHDLPLLNDHCIRLGFEPLGSKLVQDTMTGFMKVKGLGKGQENLGALLGLDEGKHHMTGTSWRQANTLSDAGREETRKRVVDDVVQHKALRAVLVERNLLKAPRLWSP